MTVTPLASALPMLTGRPIDATVLAASEADIFMSTVDAKGRLALAGPAATMGWTMGQELYLCVQDGGLLLSQSPRANFIHTMAVVLDTRCRVVLPYFVRVQNNLGPGIRLVVLAAPVEGLLAALPAARVAAALLGNP